MNFTTFSPSAQGPLEEAAAPSVTWDEISARQGRNDLPYLLAVSTLIDKTLTDPQQIAVGFTQAWTMAEWPAMTLDQEVWTSILEKAVDIETHYLKDGEVRPLSELPETVTLWRGAIPARAEGMSWSSDRSKAQWFAKRFGGEARLYEITIPAESLVLAIFEDARNESEWVIDPLLLAEDDVQEVK